MLDPRIKKASVILVMWSFFAAVVLLRFAPAVNAAAGDYYVNQDTGTATFSRSYLYQTFTATATWRVGAVRMYTNNSGRTTTVYLCSGTPTTSNAKTFGDACISSHLSSGSLWIDSGAPAMMYTIDLEDATIGAGAYSLLFRSTYVSGGGIIGVVAGNPYANGQVFGCSANDYECYYYGTGEDGRFSIVEGAPADVEPTVLLEVTSPIAVGDTTALDGSFGGAVGAGYLVDSMTIIDDEANVLETCEYDPATAAGGCSASFTPTYPSTFNFEAIVHTVSEGYFSDVAEVVASDEDLELDYFTESGTSVDGEYCQDLTIIDADCGTDWTLVDLLCSFPADFINSSVNFLFPTSCADFEAMNAAAATVSSKAPFADAASIVRGFGNALSTPSAATCEVGIDAPPPWESMQITLWDCDAIVGVYGQDEWNRTGRLWLAALLAISTGLTAYAFSRRIHGHFSS